MPDDFTSIPYDLKINGDYYNHLDIEGFSHMMDSPSSCYKFYWLEAIVNLISEGVSRTTFDEIINEMIANAWYSVREYHINLSGIYYGDKDALQRAVNRLAEVSGLAANASKVEIKNKIKEYDKDLKEAKDQLIKMVPYRALSGFLSKLDGYNGDDGIKRITAYIELVNNVTVLPYTFGKSLALKKEVFFNPDWMKMIQDNTVPILGWIQYKKLNWLQNNNPEVPGMIYKLTPMDATKRKLNAVRKLWDAIFELKPIKDVFTEEDIDCGNYDVDHFIPRNFVMNDELWNLIPMDPSLNSSKSDKLPKWKPFFKRFSNNQYQLYSLIHDDNYPGIHKLFVNCYKDNLHSIWANRELYNPNNSIEKFKKVLEKNMRPVYDSARRQGYELWIGRR